MPADTPSHCRSTDNHSERSHLNCLSTAKHEVPTERDIEPTKPHALSSHGTPRVSIPCSRPRPSVGKSENNQSKRPISQARTPACRRRASVGYVVAPLPGTNDQSNVTLHIRPRVSETDASLT
ncbi:hypothetical protein RB1602 [Rhodopirellula baltica SH 1]|uniref:Uncharacterized protein n=1 Tax=Rhodopirellula baltica (strain DSM 10527 / NCIMB 13988 / SH1) TaxID=243090 RepID=Q7UX29_RHOBA|nr:hypothetical protein RB1602 [Rhodopirellula baltica SH 1]